MSNDETPNEWRPPNSKQAVVVIHGMGNQSPMSTLREFVEAVWNGDERVAKENPPRTWTKHDLMSRNYELRRITTNFDRKNRRTDFFEFYWADQMDDTRLADIVWWLKRLFIRPLDRLPPGVRETWIAGVVVLLVIASGFATFVWLQLLTLQAIPQALCPAAGWFMLSALLVAGFWLFRHIVLIMVLGDAARYLTASPRNIAARSRVRHLGLALLQKLHRAKEYDRIVLACHSLGAVIGYDILNFCWSNINSSIHHAQTDSALLDLEASIGVLREHPDDPRSQVEYRNAQRRYADSIRTATGGCWKVTDFVTLGSPLTHAHFLMVNDRDRLLESDSHALDMNCLAQWRSRLDLVTRRVASLFFARVGQREFPICPPLSEQGNGFTFQPPGSQSLRPHHAAVFGAVRWTNIYAPCESVLWGDLIGGPASPLFGPGVKDVPLTGSVGKKLFAHTSYWETDHGDHQHLEALRNAINILDEPDTFAATPSAGGQP